MISFNKYVDETLARTRTVCFLVKCIEVLLKYARKDMPAGVRNKCEQVLAEHHNSIHSGRGKATTKWDEVGL